jgi:hypothetical protein
MIIKQDTDCFRFQENYMHSFVDIWLCAILPHMSACSFPEI